jgi:hypothetical protein
MMNFLFNANIHTEQENQQHDVAHEWRQVALQEASNPHEDRRFFLFALLSFSLRNQTFSLLFRSYCVVCKFTVARSEIWRLHWLIK